MTLPQSGSHSRSSSDPVHRLAPRRRPGDPLAGHARPHRHACGDHRGRAIAGRLRGVGPAPARPAAPDGHWGDGIATPLWWSNMYTLLFLRDLGIDPASPRARTAIDRVRSHVTWGAEFGNSPFFEGEVEPCINGRVVALGAYFGERSDRLVDRLLSEQLTDGGWNCEAERGSVRSSFHTTICVLEGLLAFEQAFGAAPAVTDARGRAQSTSSSVACSEGCRPATSSTRRGSSSPFRRSGTTTCCVRSTISALQASSRTRESRRPSRPSSSGGREPAAGCSTCGTATPYMRNWPALSERRIAGSRCARSGCWTGTRVTTERFPLPPPHRFSTAEAGHDACSVISSSALRRRKAT